MDSTRKRRSLLSLFDGMGATLRELAMERPQQFIREAREKLKDLPKTNFELGLLFSEQGKWHDAMFRFRITLYLQPNYPHAWYNLGCAYFKLGKRAQASAALQKALLQQPGNSDTIFMLAAMDPAAVVPSQRPQTMPKAMVESYFSSIASTYDVSELRKQYRGGQAVYEQLKLRVSETGLTLVDVGCGSGIAARPWRAHAFEIIGIDATPAMQLAASDVMIQGQKLMDQYIVADMMQPSDALPTDKADLVLAVNCVQYMGELNGTMLNVAKMLKNGGVFAVTIEPYAGQGGFGLNPETGSFSYQATYVKQMAASVGLAVAHEVRVNLYPASTAELLIFTKGSK